MQENVCVIIILLRKWCHNNKHFSELDSHRGGKTAGIDMVWRNYVTVTLCSHVIYVWSSHVNANQCMHAYFGAFTNVNTFNNIWKNILLILTASMKLSFPLLTLEWQPWGNFYPDPSTYWLYMKLAKFFQSLWWLFLKLARLENYVKKNVLPAMYYKFNMAAETGSRNNLHSTSEIDAVWKLITSFWVMLNT